MKERPMMVKCPVCEGHKAIPGRSSGPYVGSPATLPCGRCSSTGEVDYKSLTEEEKTPKPKPFFPRDDNP